MRPSERHALLDGGEALREFKDPAGYFPSGTRDVQEVGCIQVMGATHLLGLMCEESL
jgi:hypothetical protein